VSDTKYPSRMLRTIRRVDGQIASLLVNPRPRWDAVRRRNILVVVLTLASGSVDAVGFLRLGGVFTSVMTANMVLLGISAATHDAALALHNGTAFGGYVIGVVGGSRIAGRASESQPVWPRRISVAIGVELVALIIFSVLWEVSGAHPSASATYPLLAINALALGIQSAVVLRFGESGLSTTYLTGTLTQLLGNLSRRGQLPKRSIAILAALICGGAVGALLTIDAPRFVPVAPLAALLAALAGSQLAFSQKGVT
jgi:uncharacterized membrane protein YoaK (UPF0700 family)